MRIQKLFSPLIYSLRASCIQIESRVEKCVNLLLDSPKTSKVYGGSVSCSFEDLVADHQTVFFVGGAAADAAAAAAVAASVVVVVAAVVPEEMNISDLSNISAFMNSAPWEQCCVSSRNFNPTTEA